MSEMADGYEARPRDEDVERPVAGEGNTEDAEPPRGGESVEGREPV